MELVLKKLQEQHRGLRKASTKRWENGDPPIPLYEVALQKLEMRSTLYLP
jgi:hypothetical protein